jgi:acylphosphatase
MANKEYKAKIVLKGLVQGVGFRYFVMKHAHEIGVRGFVKNLMSGEVYVEAEGERYQIEDLFEKLKVGPRSAQVNDYSIEWEDGKNEFSTFEVRH